MAERKKTGMHHEMERMHRETMFGRGEDKQAGPNPREEGKGREARTMGMGREHPMHKEIRAEHERHHKKLHEIANRHLKREPKKEAKEHERKGEKRMEEHKKEGRKHESEGMKKAMEHMHHGRKKKEHY
jgi:hypothetical protein